MATLTLVPPLADDPAAETRKANLQDQLRQMMKVTRDLMEVAEELVEEERTAARPQLRVIRGAIR